MSELNSEIKLVLFDLNGVLVSSSFQSGVNKPLISLIEKLRENGYKTGIITNVPGRKQRLESIFGKPIEELFDSIVTSIKVGSLKPNKKIYEVALENLEVRPEQAFFIDDTLRNVKGAKSIGMKAFHYHSNQEMFNEFIKLGLVSKEFTSTI
jgi:putative hydrolase of the HAD superfamily